MILAILLIFAGCSPQKRLKRLVDKHPELIQIDTIRDTITTTAVHIDTAFKYKAGDTVVIEKDKVRTELIFLPGDTVKVNTDKQADTIYIEKTVPTIYNNSSELKQLEIEVNKLERKFWPAVCLAFIAGLISAILLAFSLRQKKP